MHCPPSAFVRNHRIFFRHLPREIANTALYVLWNATQLSARQPKGKQHDWTKFQKLHAARVAHLDPNDSETALQALWTLSSLNVNLNSFPQKLGSDELTDQFIQQYCALTHTTRPNDRHSNHYFL